MPTCWCNWKCLKLICFPKCNDIMKWIRWTDSYRTTFTKSDIDQSEAGLCLRLPEPTLALNKLLYWPSLKKSAIAHKAVIFTKVNERRHLWINSLLLDGETKNQFNKLFCAIQTCLSVVDKILLWLKLIPAKKKIVFDSSSATVMHRDYISSNVLCRVFHINHRLAGCCGNTSPFPFLLPIPPSRFYVLL